MYIEYNYYCGAYMYLFCLQRLALKDKIYITGCLDAVWEWFRNHLLVVAAVAVAFAFPEVRILSFTYKYLKVKSTLLEHMSFYLLLTNYRFKILSGKFHLRV